MTICVVIVVFNKEISSSVTCSRLLRNGKYNILVVDNSTKANKNQEYCEKQDISYLSMGGNKGLSKAYNAAIEYCHDADVIVFMDDDTEVPDVYFKKLNQAVNDNPDIDIFAPIIKGQDGVVYSPNNYCFLKNHLVSSPIKDVKSDRFNAISSCLAVRKTVFDNYRYNEKLFVDEVDHCFCREQRKRRKRFGIINVVINQNFHQRELNIQPDKAWAREKIRITDIFRHARIIGGGIYILLAFIKGCGLGVQIGKRSKSFKVMLKAIGLSFTLVFLDR